MNYDQFKSKVVENELSDVKGARSLTVKLALMVALYGIALALATMMILSPMFSVVVFIVAVALFFLCTDLAVQDKESYSLVDNIVKYWWTGIICDVLVVVLLVFFRFM